MDYCVMKNGDNVATYDNECEAIEYAKEEEADKVLEVYYDDNGNETGCECVWSWEDFEYDNRTKEKPWDYSRHFE